MVHWQRWAVMVGGWLSSKCGFVGGGAVLWARDSRLGHLHVASYQDAKMAGGLPKGRLVQVQRKCAVHFAVFCMGSHNEGTVGSHGICTHWPTYGDWCLHRWSDGFICMRYNVFRESCLHGSNTRGLKVGVYASGTTIQHLQLGWYIYMLARNLEFVLLSSGTNQVLI
jgi:hypothetical protein